MNKAFTPDALKDAAAFISGLEDKYLEDVAELIQREITTRKQANRQQAILQIQKIMAEAGLSRDELEKLTKPKAAHKTSGNPVPAKFRHPETGASWSGRGRAPLWVGEWKAVHGNLEGITV